ncbi:MAG TPA: NAD(P)/FAD-dependent oxidoreductase [Casimicrobiaceae bacterium]|nr:NAD(P)/FAD-dependent oxidoreductase [Casimicrobiaceae bacterium]
MNPGSVERAAAHDFDVVVVGGGAAGMHCAAIAGARGRRVLLIEHFGIVGEKIRISGGGRCNFTNTNASPANYLSANPDFCRSALARYTPSDFVALVERHRIPWHEKKLGQLFCDDSALRIIAMLKTECGRANVTWWQPCPVNGVACEAGKYLVSTPNGAARAGSLVIATGGLSVPKIGATAFGYEVARQFGLAVVPPRPALVPLAFAPDMLERFGDLAGVSTDVNIACNGADFRENLLFTHRGLSGPAILQVSSYWDRRSPIRINLFPGGELTAWLGTRRTSASGLHNILAERIPRRLAQAWCAAHDVARPLRELNDAQIAKIGAALSAWHVVPSGTLGWNKAEVTIGGVDTRGLSSKTMMAKTAPGLYFIGECVDITGWLGGYNFQWAWSSAHAAALAV